MTVGSEGGPLGSLAASPSTSAYAMHECLMISKAGCQDADSRKPAAILGDMIQSRSFEGFSPVELSTIAAGGASARETAPYGVDKPTMRMHKTRHVSSALPLCCMYP